MSVYYTLVLSFFLFLNTQTGRVLLTLYALKLGARPFIVGALAAMLSVMPALLSWQVGRFSDRFGCRWLLTVGTGAGILGLLTAYLLPGIPALCVTAAMYGILTACYASPLQNLVGLQSGPQDRVKNFSNFSLVFTISSMAGPLLAGFSLDHAGPGISCLLLLSLLLAPGAMLLFWGGILPGGTQDRKPQEGVRALLAESGLWRVLATSSLLVTGLDLFQVYVPIYGHGIGLSASVIGFILAICSLASFIARIFIPNLLKRFTAEKVLACSFLLGSAGFLLAPLFKGVILLSLVSFFFGLGAGGAQPITMMMTFSSSNKGRSGEAMGLRITVNHLTRMAGQVLFGSVSSAFGVFAVFWLNALLFASGWAFSRPRSGRTGEKEKGGA